MLLDKSTQTRIRNDRIFVEEKEAIIPIEEEIKTISKAFDMEETEDVKELLASIIDTYTIDKKIINKKNNLPIFKDYESF